MTMSNLWDTDMLSSPGSVTCFLIYLKFTSCPASFSTFHKGKIVVLLMERRKNVFQSCA